MDSENADILLSFLQETPKRMKKFNYLISVILENQPTEDIFKHEDIHEGAKGVYAIRMVIEKVNTRIYCKTYEKADGFHIILAEYLKHKNTQKVNQEIKNIINKVAEYEYELSERDED